MAAAAGAGRRKSRSRSSSGSRSRSKEKKTKTTSTKSSSSLISKRKRTSSEKNESKRKLTIGELIRTLSKLDPNRLVPELPASFAGGLLIALIKNIKTAGNYVLLESIVQRHYKDLIKDDKQMEI